MFWKKKSFTNATGIKKIMLLLPKYYYYSHKILVVATHILFVETEINTLPNDISDSKF